MNALIPLIGQILKKVGPDLIMAIVGMFLGNKGQTGPVSEISRAAEKSKDRVEWIVEVQSQAGADGSGEHPLDRLMTSALESEETIAKTKRGFRGALNIGLDIAKKVIF